MKQCAKKQLVLTNLCQDELKELKAGKNENKGNYDDSSEIVVYFICPGDSAKYI